MRQFQTLTDHMDRYFFQYVITIVMLLLLVVSRIIILKFVKKHTLTHNISQSRELYMRKIISVAIIFLFSVLIGITWEISLKGLSLYFASIFTVVGVALFANWSILSNVTASFILFFFFPYRIGEKIKIIDGDNSIEGRIVDINLFYIKIEAEGLIVYSYPNNVALQKPIRHIKS